MQFEYLALADAANVGSDGKVNVLGMGARIISYERLPGSSPLALLALVTGLVDEAGEYPVLVELEEPDGTRERMIDAVASIAADADPRVPTGISLVLNFSRPFRIGGLHTIHVRVGAVEQRYAFLVQVRNLAGGSDHKSSRVEVSGEARTTRTAVRHRVPRASKEIASQG